MRNKKLVSLSVASVLAAGAVASTLAWFTSQDIKVSAFEISGDSNMENGVKVIDTFEGNTKLFPGDTVVKKVYIENKANYDQIVRAKIEKVWKTVINGEEKQVSYYKIEGEEVVYLTEEEKMEGDGAELLDYGLIKLNFNSSNLTDAVNTSKKIWVENKDTNYQQNSIMGYYYYNDILQSNLKSNLNNEYIESRDIDSTKDLLESVTLLGDVSEIYKNLKFEVIVTAEGIQAANNAVLSWNKDGVIIPEVIKSLAKNYKSA